MYFHFVGIVWISIVLMSYLKKMSNTIILTITSLIFMGTSFFSSEVVSISIFEMSAILMIIRYVFIDNYRLYISKVMKMLMIVVIFMIMISILDGFIFSGFPIKLYIEYNKVMYDAGTDYVCVDSSFIIALFRLVLYVVSMMIICSYSYISNDKEKIIIGTLTLSSVIVLSFGIIQWLTSKGIANLHFLVHLVHNEGADAYTAGYDKLFSVFDEPSYCGPWLNALFWSLMFSKYKYRFKIIIIAITGLELLLTLSSTGVICFCVMGIIWIFYKKIDAKKILALMLGISAICIVFIFSSQGQRLLNEVVNKMNSTSGVARITYIKDCYDTMVKTFGLGVGYSQIKCMTLISGLLAQIGIVGTLIFVWTLFKLVKCESRKEEDVIAKTFFVAILIGTEVSCSGLVYAMPFWYGMMMISVIAQKRDCRKEFNRYEEV